MTIATDNSAAPNALRYAFIVQLFAGLLFLGLGYFTGRSHLRLVLHGERAQGTIVDYKAKDFNTSRAASNLSQVGYMPVVEYRANDRIVRFDDWLGRSVEGVRNQPVTVLYDPADLSTAMIDRPIWNWMPWAPVMALGVLLLGDGVRRGISRFSPAP